MEYHFSVVVIGIQATKAMGRWFYHLGGLGLIPLGLLDASVLPLPGSMDILTLVLAAHQPEWWVYYAVMATIGSVAGNYLTYRLARKGGQETLERRLSRANMAKVNRIFTRWGFAAIAIPALLPPPVPMVPFILAAGAAKYSLKKFLLALTLARMVRYSVLALLAAHYSRQIIHFIRLHGHPAILAVIGVVVSVAAVLLVMRYGKKKGGPKRGTKSASVS